MSNQVEFLVSRAGRWAFIGIYRDSWKSNALNFSYSILLDDNVDRADRGGSSAVYQSDSPQDQAVERALPSPPGGRRGNGLRLGELAERLMSTRKTGAEDECA